MLAKNRCVYLKYILFNCMSSSYFKLVLAIKWQCQFSNRTFQKYAKSLIKKTKGKGVIK